MITPPAGWKLVADTGGPVLAPGLTTAPKDESIEVMISSFVNWQIRPWSEVKDDTIMKGVYLEETPWLGLDSDEIYEDQGGGDY